MKRIIIVFLMLTLASPILAAVSKKSEALVIAQNWTRYIIQRDGSWGGSGYANVTTVEELKSSDQLVGYLCAVQPKGFIVVSLLRELAPVKAFSTGYNLDAQEEEGAAMVIKKNMAGILKTLDRKTENSRTASSLSLQGIVKDDYTRAWDELEKNSMQVRLIRSESSSSYQEGDTLLMSNWEQGFPYNNDCPNMVCSDIGNGKAPVGCTALAGAQIMYYWSWPWKGEGAPYDNPYYWNYMFDWCNANATQDSKGAAINQARISAVARLCHEVGQAIDMNYTCDGSGASMQAMSNAYTDHFRYPQEVHKMDRAGDNAATWFQYVKNDINKNQPVQLAYYWEESTTGERTGHSIVVDGWREDGSTPLRYYHLNFGWIRGLKCWYQVDEIPKSDDDSEEMIINIVPLGAIGSTILPIYPRESFAFRYFNMDAICAFGSKFEAGQNLQFLPGVKITEAGLPNLFIEFSGIPGRVTMLFSHHGIHNKGAFCKIFNGKIKIYTNGGLKVGQ